MAEQHSITVTRALVELKTVDRRIKKAQEGCVFVTYKSGSEDTPKNKITESKLQKVTDLIERRKALKAAIVKSNAITTVKIGDREYTVAEAIERKSSISYEKELLRDMKVQLGNVTRQVEVFNEKVQAKLDGMLEKSFGSNQKASADELKAFSESYLRSNRAEIVDPLDLGERIEKLETKIVDFESEVDLVLSESNATTTIQV